MSRVQGEPWGFLLIELMTALFIFVGIATVILNYRAMAMSGQNHYGRNHGPAAQLAANSYRLQGKNGKNEISEPGRQKVRQLHFV